MHKIKFDSIIIFEIPWIGENSFKKVENKHGVYFLITNKLLAKMLDWFKSPLIKLE